MGIKDINKTCKDVISDIITELRKTNPMYPDLGFRTVSLETFAGTRVAFDLSIIINAKMNTAHNDLLGKQRNIAEMYTHDQLMAKTIKLILGFFGSFIKSGITPVIVCDGKMHPAKLACVQGRIEEKKQRQANANMLVDNYLNLTPLDRTKDVEDALTHALRNNVKITQHDKELIKSVLQQFGFTCLTAEYDGENLCAALSREGIVSAVFGNDTDNYPLGTNVLITKVEWNGQTQMCEIAVLSEIKSFLSVYMGRQIDDIGFLDLCILHGCDFNNYQRMQIPQKRDPSKTKSVGGKTALDLIRDHYRFEYFPAHYWPYMGPLNIQVCRNMFAHTPSGINPDDTNLDWDTFHANAIPLLKQYQCEGYIFSYYQAANPQLLKINSQQYRLGIYKDSIEPIIEGQSGQIVSSGTNVAESFIAAASTVVGSSMGSVINSNIDSGIKRAADESYGGYKM